MKDSIEKATDAIIEINKLSTAAIKELKVIKKLLFSGEIQKASSIVSREDIEKLFNSLNLRDIYIDLKSTVANYVAKIRMNFDHTFKAECFNFKIQDVQGNSMEHFRINGILSVKPNFSKNTCDISTFATCKTFKSVDPAIIAKEVRKEINRLFDRPFEPSIILNALYDAYISLKPENSKAVLLKDIHKKLWMKMQKVDFFDKSEPSKMKVYPTDEFAVDLGKLLDSNFKRLKNNMECRLSLGSNGINIYKKDGSFNSYKFIEFVDGGKNA